MNRPWSYVDFVLVVLGGILGAFVAAVVTVEVDSDDLVVMISIVGQFLGHLLVIWLLARDRDPSDLGFSVLGRDLLYLPLGALGQVVLAILFNPLARRLLPESDSAQEIGDVIGSVESTAVLVTIIAVTLLVAPVVEELMFRGVLVKAMGNSRPWTIMVVTALVFASRHLVGLDPETFIEAAAVVLPKLFIVGVALAWVTLRTGRLGPAIMLHSGFNLVAAIAILAAR